MAYAVFVVLWTLCYSFENALTQQLPLISQISQEQIKDIGETVEFSCSVQNTQNSPVLWIKVDRNSNSQIFPISSNSTLILHDARFDVRYNHKNETYTLIIKDIQKTDAGVYQCQILISATNKTSAEVELLVRQPPVISDNFTRSLVVSEGESTQLECYADGYPTPKISWRRADNGILPTRGSIYHGNILKIKNIHREDRGTYFCVAENGVDRKSTRGIEVEVECAPIVSVLRPRIGQALHYRVDLECRIDAYPAPSIFWIKDDTNITTNKEYSISHFETDNHFVYSSVRINSIETSQYGQYVCRAMNKLGTAEARIELFESVIPVCSPACDQTHNSYAAISSSTVALIIAFIFQFCRNTHII